MDEFYKTLFLVAAAGVYLLHKGLKGYIDNERYWNRGDSKSKQPWKGSAPYPKKTFNKNWEAGRIHETSDGIKVRSKSEVIVYEALISHGLAIEYEKKLFGQITRDSRYPDFTIRLKNRLWYWEHVGMLDDYGYRQAWEKKKIWYLDNGYWPMLLVSQDYPGGVLKVGEIHKLVRERILEEGGKVGLTRSTPGKLPPITGGDNVILLGGEELNNNPSDDDK